MKKLNKITNILLSVITVCAILAIWGIMAKRVGSEYILPSVKQTFGALKSVIVSKRFFIALGGTFLRTVIAFAISFCIAFGFAVLSNRIRAVRVIFNTVVSILRALPTVAIVLILLFWTSAQVAPVIVTLLVVLPTTYSMILTALDSIDKTVLEAGKVDGANKIKLFFGVEIPLILPTIFIAIGGGISLNFKLMVASEVISATVKSIGNIINIYNYNAEIAQMLAVVVVVITIAIIIESLFNKLAEVFGAWR